MVYGVWCMVPKQHHNIEVVLFVSRMWTRHHIQKMYVLRLLKNATAAWIAVFVAHKELASSRTNEPSLHDGRKPATVCRSEHVHMPVRVLVASAIGHLLPPPQ